MRVERKLISVCAVLFFGCKNSNPTSGVQPVYQKLSADSSFVTEVETVIERPTTFSYKLESIGKVLSNRDQGIFSEFGGTLEYFPVKVGMRIREGQLIARLSTEMLDIKKEKARLQLFQAKKEFESQLLGYEKLFEKATNAERYEITEKIRIASGVAVALQDLKEIEYELSKSVIKAQFSGIAADIGVRQGENIKEGTRLFRLYQSDSLMASVKLLETDLKYVKETVKTKVYPVGLTKAFQATFHSFNPVVDDNGMITVNFLIKKANENIFVGMNCSVEVLVPEAFTLAVPRNALVYKDGKIVVFTFVNGKAKWNYVLTGRDNGDKVEIINGLNSGDEVIISNNFQLAHNAPVRRVPVRLKP